MTPPVTAERVAEQRAVAPPRPEIPLHLLSSFAHELRTPLSALAASAEMIETAHDPADRQRFAAVIQRQTRRLSGIVDALLAAYSASRGGLAPEPARFDATELLDELCEEQRLLAPGHLFRVGGERPVLLRSDRRVLGIVLGNLLSNAARYSPRGSTVHVSVARTGAAAVFQVSDEGPGVAEEMRARIFRPGEGAPGGEGFGLGLFIARRLCDAIGAEISVSDTAGGGACFIVTLGAEEDGA